MWKLKTLVAIAVACLQSAPSFPADEATYVGFNLGPYVVTFTEPADSQDPNALKQADEETFSFCVASLKEKSGETSTACTSTKGGGLCPSEPRAFVGSEANSTAPGVFYGTKSTITTIDGIEWKSAWSSPIALYHRFSKKDGSKNWKSMCAIEITPNDPKVKERPRLLFCEEETPTPQEMLDPEVVYCGYIDRCNEPGKRIKPTVPRYLVDENGKPVSLPRNTEVTHKE